MKKIIFTIIICLLVLSPVIIKPLNTSAAKANNLKQLRADLNGLIAKKNKADNDKKKTEGEITTAKKNITSAEAEIQTNRGKTEDAKKKVEESEKSLENQKESMKNVIASYQMSSGDNEYLQFVFNAQSMTDLIYRYAVSEQLMQWQTEEIKRYEELITTNKKLQIDLANRETQLNKSIDNLADKIDSLGDRLSEFSEISMDIADEIKSTREYIKFLEDAGCGEDEDIDICLGAVSDSGFKKPLVSGRVTSTYGYRRDPIKGIQSFHGAMDIGGNAEGTNVYAAAAGVVGKIINKASCGGNSVYIFHTVNGKKYTTQYTHLLAIKVSIGEIVTKNTVIGTVGGGSTAKNRGGYDTCTTGPHLHFAMANGHYGGTGLNSYSNYSTYLANTFDPQKFFGLPAGTGVTWSSR